MDNYNSYKKYIPVRVCGNLQDEYRKSSRMVVGLLSLIFMSLKEAHILHRGYTKTATLLVLMVANATSVAEIILMRRIC